MRFPLARDWTITTGFDQPRPLTVPPRKRKHKHGSWDIAAPAGTPVLAPEPGRLYYFCAWRPDLSRRMRELKLSDAPFDMAGYHYFYDTYGALIILIGDSGKAHVICHAWLNQLYNDNPTGNNIRWTYRESPKVERWPLACLHTFHDTNVVMSGEHIGAVGSAGLSSGPHIHYEIHPRAVWTESEKRIRPETIWPEQWEAKSA